MLSGRIFGGASATCAPDFRGPTAGFVELQRLGGRSWKKRIARARVVPLSSTSVYERKLG